MYINTHMLTVRGLLEAGLCHNSNPRSWIYSAFQLLSPCYLPHPSSLLSLFFLPYNLSLPLFPLSCFLYLPLSILSLFLFPVLHLSVPPCFPHPLRCPAVRISLAGLTGLCVCGSLTSKSTHGSLCAAGKIEWQGAEKSVKSELILENREQRIFL